MDISQRIYDTALNEFMDICKVPHSSNEVDKPNYANHFGPFTKFIMTKIKSYGVKKIMKDDIGNIWFDIPASKGCNNFKKIILQSHMDMVWDAVKEATKWNRWTHPISQPVIEKIKGELVMHTNKYLTSLGADDGEGMAIILSVLKHREEFKHGNIRCLLTVDEEPGLIGAQKLGIIKGKQNNVVGGYDYLLNIDTPLLNTIIASSAGGRMRKWIIDKIVSEKVNKQPIYQIAISDCHGGHSADQIDDGYANPVKLANEILLKIGDVKLISFTTPNTEVNNKIPKESLVKFVSNKSNNEIKKIVTACMQLFKKQYKAEKNIKINFKKISGSFKCIKELKDTKHILNLIKQFPYGPLTRFNDDHFVETSCNIAPIELNLNNEHEQFVLQTYFRSANLKKIDSIDKQIVSIFNKIIKSNFKKASSNLINQIPPWEYKKVNPLMDLAIKGYKKIGIKARTYKVHCALECSYFVKQNPKLCQISIGPQTDFEHNVRETLHLASYKNLAKVILYMLSNL